jgi:hypothetical protein
MLFTALLLACTPHAPPATAPVPAATTPVAEPQVSFSSLETRAAVLSAELEDADARERVAELRELMAGMRGQPASAQRKVFGYAARVLAIEERDRPDALAFPGFDSVLEVVSETVAEVPASHSTATSTTGTPPADDATRLTDARAALAAKDPTRALAILDGLDTPPARALRRSAIDAWAAAEREAAGADFLTARALPAGPARIAALTAVRDRLAAINVRHPDNAVATEVARHLERVEAALAEPSPTEP